VEHRPTLFWPHHGFCTFEKNKYFMGLVHASIELINSADKEMARRRLMDPDEVRRIRVRAMVDSGALHMAINENIQEYLQLPVVGKERLELASGEVDGVNECHHSSDPPGIGSQLKTSPIGWIASS
jgi:hypothetical protein